MKKISVVVFAVCLISAIIFGVYKFNTETKKSVMKPVKEIIYIAGVVQDNSNLLKLTEKGYENVYCHHMTIKYGNIDKLPEYIGTEFNFKSNLIFKDEKAIAITGTSDNVKVQEVMKENNQKAHITICTGKDIQPVYSNTLIQTGKGENLEMNVKMKVGAFCIFEDDSKDWIFSK